MISLRQWFWAWIVAGCLCWPVTAATAAPLVSGFERFGRAATDPAARVEAGLLLLGELGCVNCHAASAEAAAHLRPKRGPELKQVGERLKPEWFASYLGDPHAVKTATTMPNLLAGLPAADRERTATALAHYLAATGRLDERPVPDGQKASPKEGLAIYERVGCAACHGSRAKPDTKLPDQIPLVGLGEKWSPRALDAFLADPLAIRPGSRMPAPKLNDQERRHLVASLLGRLAASQEAAEYGGVVAFNGRAWKAELKNLSGIESLGTPARTGPVQGLDVFAFAGAREGVVVRLDGFFHARTAGPYTFHLTSDDGSRLTIDDRIVIDNDGVHPEVEKGATVELQAGTHPIVVDYFEAGGGEALKLDVVTPRGLRGSAVGLVTPTVAGTPAAKPEPEDAGPGFVVDKGLAAEGRTAFAAVGCANCHRLPDEQGKEVAATLRAKPLAEIASLDGGCLGSAPQAGNAWYGIDAEQRQAIAAAVGWLRTSESGLPPSRERTIDRTLTALNCYACHSRDGRGGVIPAVATVDEDGEPVLKEPARDAIFTSRLQELGDEGRLPPTLTGVGDKLSPGFLHEVLVKGGGDRELTMNTLMPRFHPAVAKPLATLLAEDPHTAIAIPELAGHPSPEIDEQGRSLVGSKMLGCIKCHAFGGDKGQSLGLIDMTRMPKRLRHEWFLAYVADPQRFRPGTRMPAAWPDGKTFYADVLDGTAAGQIEAVWRYLSGPKPRPPLGATLNPIELVPGDRPIIYRNFIEGAGPRGIAVGYPEKVHVAWDADQLRLALAWRGAFIDAARHWTGRGQGFQPPLGDMVFTPDAATPLAAFESESAARSAAWPKGSVRDALGPVAGHRFKGYALDAAGRPAFGWRWGECEVRDEIVPATFTDLPGRAGPVAGLRRTITVSGPPLPAAACRVAVGKTIDDEGQGWHLVDKAWRVRVVGGEVVRRDADGRVELRVPLDWKQGRAVVEENLAW